MRLAWNEYVQDDLSVQEITQEMEDLQAFYTWKGPTRVKKNH